LKFFQQHGGGGGSGTLVGGWTSQLITAFRQTTAWLADACICYCPEWFWGASQKLTWIILRMRQNWITKIQFQEQKLFSFGF